MAVQTLFDKLESKFSIDAASLVVLKGPHQGQTLKLEQEIVQVGRGDWCDLQLSGDRKVSNEHCEIVLDSKGFRIRDLHSRNGVFVNDVRVLVGYLSLGSIIQLGDTEIQLQAHDQLLEIERFTSDGSGTLFGMDESMRYIFSRMRKLANRDVMVLLTGETGTGKTSIAKALHLQSTRSNGPFVEVNCGALPANLVEPELFGFERGAFTGATSTHKGLFEQANKGTLFLDEIGELPLELQPKLLQVLEKKQVRRVGGTKTIDVDCRIITATHRSLPHEVAEGRFREDLYFRLAVIELEVPPLRERASDIPLLIQAFLRQLNPNESYYLSPEASQAVQTYSWPGNIRQLRNVLERAVVFLEGNVIELGDLYLPVAEPEPRPPSANKWSSFSGKLASSDGDSTTLQELNPASLLDGSHTLQELTEAFEKSLLVHALEKTEGNVKEASLLLDISQGWLYKRIRKFKLKT